MVRRRGPEIANRSLNPLIADFCKSGELDEGKRLREEAEQRKRKEWEISHLHILAQEMYEEMKRNGQLAYAGCDYYGGDYYTQGPYYSRLLQNPARVVISRDLT